MGNSQPTKRFARNFWNTGFLFYNLISLFMIDILVDFSNPHDGMLSERGVAKMPEITLWVAAFFFIIFLISVGHILSSIWFRGVTTGLAIKTVIVFAITAPCAFGIVFFALENPLTPENTCIANAVSNHDPLYFSYSSFTTLVHGDLEPIGICRIISTVEALCGYLFLSLLAGIWFRLLVPETPPNEETLASETPPIEQSN